MGELLLARPWDEIKPLLESEGMLYQTAETRSQRDFFPLDEMVLYVIRVGENSGGAVATLTPAPARSKSVIAYEENFL